MRFELLMLAESASPAPRGKINVLGLGSRVITLETVPETVPLSIVGMVEVPLAEAGTYDLRVTVTDPNGQTTELIHHEVETAADVEDERLPTGLSFVIANAREYDVVGIYTLKATMGPASAEYPFVVRLPDSVASKGSDKGRKKQRRKKPEA